MLDVICIPWFSTRNGSGHHPLTPLHILNYLHCMLCLNPIMKLGDCPSDFPILILSNTPFIFQPHCSYIQCHRG